MHPYHCDCDHCDHFGSYAYRVQRDSSCAGEVISRVLSYDDDGPRAQEIMVALQDSAVMVDAEPGYDAGFHVHVDVTRRTRYEQMDMLWAFMRWEPVLRRIAAGRFETQRSNNTLVRGCNANMFMYDSYMTRFPWWDGGRSLPANAMHTVEQELSTAELFAFKDHVLANHFDQDRHSNLNIRTHHGTWEYRLWNSTRSAWRMELWCLLSLAFADPVVVGELNTCEFPAIQGRHRQNPPPATDPLAYVNLAVILDGNGYEKGAELLTKQVGYMHKVEDGQVSVHEALTAT